MTHSHPTLSPLWSEILSFLGLTWYSRLWVPNFYLLTKPIFDEQWDPSLEPLDPKVHSQSFDALKTVLTLVPSHFFPKNKFIYYKTANTYLTVLLVSEAELYHPNLSVLSLRWNIAFLNPRGWRPRNCSSTTDYRVSRSTQADSVVITGSEN